MADDCQHKWREIPGPFPRMARCELCEAWGHRKYDGVRGKVRADFVPYVCARQGCSAPATDRRLVGERHKFFCAADAPAPRPLA